MNQTAEQTVSIDEIRTWHRSQDYDSVIEELDEKRDSCTPQEKTLLALSQAMSGQEGTELLQEAAAQEPDPQEAMWLSDVALACLLTGQLEKSKDLLEQALNCPEAGAGEYGRMAAVKLACGDLEKAREYYQEAVHREPGQGIWHNNLAGILVRQQKLEEALENYDIAIRLKPDLEQAQNSRLRVLRALERTDEVVRELEGKLEENPDDLSLRLRLARAHDQDGQFTEAIQVLRKALVKVDEVEQPQEDLSHEEKVKTPWAEQICLRMELAGICAGRSRHWMAYNALRQVEKLKPENPVPCYAQQASALTEMGRYDQALAKLDQAEEEILKGDEPETGARREHDPAGADTAAAGERGSDQSTGDTAVADRANPAEDLESAVEAPGARGEDPGLLPLDITRASVLSEKGEYEQAEEILRRLLKTYPGNARLMTQLGQTLLWTGKLDEAADCFEEASHINPMALAQMVNARRLPEAPEALEKMRQMADNPLLAEQARSAMAFALAALYDKRKEPDEAWPYLELANRVIDRQLEYDPGDFTKRVDLFREVFSKEFFDSQPKIRKSDRAPVFVLGMPRSGTTLTEQILCSHPDIFGAGELDLMGRLTRLMPKVLKTDQNYPECLQGFTPHLREEAARFYLNGLNNYDTEHRFVVDKMPHNFMQLGLISLIFPGARIIHVNRDPRDTALSNFQQNFKARHGGLGYAFDLKKTALQINDYFRIMEHWRKVLPLPIFDLSYEQMVEDQEGTGRKLMDFLGLAWHEDMSRFYETKRAVRTASVNQVRQPIYKTSMKKWKRYADHLGELLDNLNPEVTEPWDNPTEDKNPYKSRIVREGQVVG